MTTFGENLKQQRKSRHFTQAQLAQKLQVSRSAISNWEMGRNYPDLDVLVSLSNILQISIDQLLKEAPIMVEAISQEQRRNRKRKLALRIIIPVFIILAVTTAYLLYLNVGAVNQAIVPSESAILNVNKQQAKTWRDVTWGKNPSVKGALFKRRHMITNDASSERQVELRIEDTSGRATSKPFSLDPGHSHTFQLKSRQAFRIGVRSEAGKYFLKLQ